MKLLKIKKPNKITLFVAEKWKYDLYKLIRKEEKYLEDEPFKHIVAIAASTGGPKALSIILPELPEDLGCPVVIAQHIADGFINGLDALDVRGWVE